MDLDAYWQQIQTVNALISCKAALPKLGHLNFPQVMDKATPLPKPTLRQHTPLPPSPDVPRSYSLNVLGFVAPPGNLIGHGTELTPLGLSLDTKCISMNSLTKNTNNSGHFFSTLSPAKARALTCLQKDTKYVCVQEVKVCTNKRYQDGSMYHSTGNLNPLSKKRNH